MTYHRPVLLEESVEGLSIKPDGVYVDVTFGAGGHSQAILNKLSAKGHLYGFDQDGDAIDNAFDDDRFTFIRSNFRFIQHFLKWHGVDRVDGILADLGVSSHQFDVASRGFSYRGDGPLDMRMNAHQKLTAADVVNQYRKEDLIDIFSKYGEVRNTKSLVNALMDYREQMNIETIDQFLNLLDRVYMGSKPKYLSQVFQALRIEVNKEMDVLKEFLEQSVSLLAPGGRLSVISYHSLEDRLVKKLMKTGNVEGLMVKDDYGKVQTQLRLINKKIIVPNEEEVRFNIRARSAKLRIAEKI